MKTKQEYRELWNILNAKKESLLSELASIENLMLWVELRSKTEKSKKIFVEKN